MGLISFVKNAGKKLLGMDDEKAIEKQAAEHAQDAEMAAVRENLRQRKVEARIKKQITDLGLEVEELVVSYDGEKVTVGGRVDNQETREKVALVAGNVDGVAQVDDQVEVVNPEPEATYYTVESGDTLSKIAKEQYGNANKYPVIFEANKPMLEHPDRIYPGQVLRIPPIDG